MADLPGVAREQLQVRVDGDTLVIEAMATIPEVPDMSLVHGELLSPSYRRTFTLSRDLDPKAIEAQLNHGVLRLRISKSDQAKPRHIQVQVG
jgi:HSP20 family molecular chaperone IbpA